MKNTKNAGTGWKVLAVILAFILMAGTIAGVVFWGRGNIEFIPLGSASVEDGAGGGMVTDDGKSDGIALSRSVIAPETYAEYGVSEQAESAQQLTAVVQPDNAASNTGVSWAVEWNNAESDWASGKTVTDYVTLTPSGESAAESKKATLECLQAFGEKIVVTARSTDNTSKFAECEVDYAKKLSTLTFRGSAGSSLYLNADELTPSVEKDLEINRNATVSYPTSMLPSFNNPEMGGTSIYTLEDEWDITVTLEPRDMYGDYIEGVNNYRYRFGVTETTDLTGSTELILFDFNNFIMTYCGGTYGTNLGNGDWNEQSIASMSSTDLKEIFDTFETGQTIGLLNVVAEGEYSTVHWMVRINIRYFLNNSAVTGVTLNKPHVVF